MLRLVIKLTIGWGDYGGFENFIGMERGYLIRLAVSNGDLVG